MKKRYRFSAKMLLIAFVFSLLSVNATAISIGNQVDLQKDVRKGEIISAKINSVKALDAKEEIIYDVSGFTTRPLADFDGNAYTLVECVPTGYLIYHDESGNFVESALTAPSPYEGYSGTLYYGGPTCYYAVVENRLIHTITEEIVETSEDAETYCRQMNLQLNNNKDVAAVNYVETGEASGATIASTYSTNASDIYVEDRYLISGLTTRNEMGYFDDGDKGYCGYISAGIVLLYIQNHSGLLVVPDDYLTSNGLKYKNSDFSKLLASYGGSNLTTAGLLAGDLNDYFDDNGYTLTATSSLFGSANTTRSYIDNSVPLMIGGSFPRPSNGKSVLHNIVVYGYSGDNTEFIVHYGWENYSQVRLSNLTFISGAVDYVKILITP